MKTQLTLARRVRVAGSVLSLAVAATLLLCFGFEWAFHVSRSAVGLFVVLVCFAPSVACYAIANKLEGKKWFPTK